MLQVSGDRRKTAPDKQEGRMMTPVELMMYILILVAAADLTDWATAHNKDAGMRLCLLPAHDRHRR